MAVIHNKTSKTFNTRPLRLERFEARQLMAADLMAGTNVQPMVDSSAQEQLIVELVNRARANPTAEAHRLGLDLNAGLASGSISTTPKQPLAPNAALNSAAAAHTDEMLAGNYFEHTGLNSSTPYDRAKAAGYGTGAAENIAVNSYWGAKGVCR